MIRFYGVFKPDDLENMPCDEFDSYWLAIERIEAQEQLMALNISDYPHIKQKGREKIHRGIFEKAFPVDESKSVSTEEMASILGGAINGR